jgi:hypothetical protein
MRIVRGHNRIVESTIGLWESSKPSTFGTPKNKTHRIRKTGPMRLEQGLLPCQFIVRLWLPVF